MQNDLEISLELVLDQSDQKLQSYVCFKSVYGLVAHPVDLSRNIMCVRSKVKNTKCLQCLYSLSDCGDLSKNVGLHNKVKKTNADSVCIH
jgi:hypothetical protein